ncbi:MAG: asparaginase [Myxococcales bacterium]|nr:asparaginase [Myxococcales bacterium]
MPDVRQLRGDCVESIHPFSVFAFDADGRSIVAVGDDRETAFRSACKPHQLAVSLSLLGDDIHGLTPRHLAVGSASHSGEPAHLALVREILARYECSADELRCGAHPPVHTPSAEAVLRAGESFTDLHNNCSGKHSFMLAASARNGFERDYRAPTHPLQQRIARQMSEWMAFVPRVVVDGCGVPSFVQPVSRAALAWQKLALAMGEGSASADPWTSRLHRIGWAMAEHPELTSGTGRLDLAIARNAREPIAVKIGAMGLFCIALPERRAGIAVKVHSGSTDALAAAVEWALAKVAPGVFVRPDPWEHTIVRNVVGAEVGRWTVG